MHWLCLVPRCTAVQCYSRVQGGLSCSLLAIQVGASRAAPVATASQRRLERGAIPDDNGDLSA